MDDYKKFYYAAVPYAKNTPYGEWVWIFLEGFVNNNIYPEWDCHGFLKLQGGVTFNHRECDAYD